MHGVEMDVKCGQDSNLSQCECDEMCKEQDYVRTVVQCYASGEVRSGIVLSVVISICVIEFSVPIFHIVVLILLIVIL